jgi:hypothetical protein
MRLQSTRINFILYVCVNPFHVITQEALNAFHKITTGEFYYGPGAGSCRHGKESLGSLESREFLDQLSHY